MALVKCPECGRENVSDTADSCPNCGYGIKSHFERIAQEKKREEEQKKYQEQQRQAEIESKRRQEERIKSVPRPTKPQLTAPIVTTVIAALIFWMGISQLNTSEWEVEYSRSHGNGDPHFYGGLFICIGIGLVIYAIYLFSKRIERYHLAQTDFEAYQKQVIQEEDAAKAAAQAQAAAQARARANSPKCPLCGSHNIERISTLNRATSIAVTGLASGKIGKQYKCKNCKHMW